MNKFAVTCLLALVAATQAYKIPPVQTNFDVLDKDSSGHVDRTEVDKHLDAMFDVSARPPSSIDAHTCCSIWAKYTGTESSAALCCFTYAYSAVAVWRAAIAVTWVRKILREIRSSREAQAVLLYTRLHTCSRAALPAPSPRDVCPTPRGWPD